MPARATATLTGTPWTLQCSFGGWRFEPIHAARVKTCAEAGAMLIESKLFGYMTDDLISAFYEFNRHLVPNGQKPVWIFHTEHDYLTRAVRFYPGEERVEILGGEWM